MATLAAPVRDWSGLVDRRLRNGDVDGGGMSLLFSSRRVWSVCSFWSFPCRRRPEGVAHGYDLFVPFILSFRNGYKTITTQRRVLHTRVKSKSR